MSSSEPCQASATSRQIHRKARNMDPVIAVQKLVKTYDGRPALDSMTFEVPQGQIVGFLGPNGSGKSTTVRVLLGLVRADSGSALVGGGQYRELLNPARSVGVMLENHGFHPRLTPVQHLSIAALSSGVSRNRILPTLAQVGLAKSGTMRIGTFSLGMKQRLALAQALLGEPRILILDEPSNGLDPAGMRWLREFLVSYAADGGTVLITSHVLSELERVIDSLVVISDGKVIANGTKDELLTNETLEDFYLSITSDTYPPAKEREF